MPFGSLWVQVLVSTAVVWFASAIAHMVLPHHRRDYRKLPDEDGVAAAMRKSLPDAGLYVMPFCPDPKQMKDPAVVKKYEQGPVAMLIVMRNGLPALGRRLVQWLLFCFLVSFISAYVARNTLTPGADGMIVMRITGTVAFAGYALGYLQDSIWKAIPWSNSLRGIADSAAYALLTGLVFRLLWP